MSPPTAPTAPPLQRWPRPLVAVDIAAFTVLENDLKLLIIHRGVEPQRHQPSLPGGLVRCGDVVVDQGEGIDDAARRELLAETNLSDVAAAGRVRLREVRAFGAPGRDTRARVITIAYLALVRPELAAFVRAGADAAAVSWVSVSTLPTISLAFDHGDIVDVCLARLRRDVHETDVTRELVPQAFTVAELRAVVDAVTGEPGDPANFRRHVRRLVEAGVLVPAAGRRVTGRRPASIYAFTDGATA